MLHTNIDEIDQDPKLSLKTSSSSYAGEHSLLYVTKLAEYPHITSHIEISVTFYYMHETQKLADMYHNING